jgi:hypothetical protein
LAAALPVLSSDCDLGATGGDSRAKAQEAYLAERFRSGARNSKFWQSIWKIHLKRTVYGAGSCRRFRILDLDPGFRRTRALGSKFTNVLAQRYTKSVLLKGYWKLMCS